MLMIVLLVASCIIWSPFQRDFEFNITHNIEQPKNEKLLCSWKFIQILTDNDFVECQTDWIADWNEVSLSANRDNISLNRCCSSFTNKSNCYAILSRPGCSIKCTRRTFMCSVEPRKQIANWFPFSLSLIIWLRNFFATLLNIHIAANVSISASLSVSSTEPF